MSIYLERLTFVRDRLCEGLDAAAAARDAAPKGSPERARLRGITVHVDKALDDIDSMIGRLAP